MTCISLLFIIWNNYQNVLLSVCPSEKLLNSIIMKSHKKLTTASGKPYVENENSQSVGPRGPLLLQDFILHEKMAHFNRERIPERVVHAKGSGAFGTFTVTHNITKYTKAKIFSELGKETKVFMRFSTVGGEKGSADTERDPRGFAIKFYTEDGNKQIRFHKEEASLVALYEDDKRIATSYYGIPLNQTGNAVWELHIPPNSVQENYNVSLSK